MTQKPDQPPSEAENAKDLGVIQRLGGVFFSPTKTLRAIVCSPDVLPPLVALMGVSVIAMEVILRKVGIDRLVRKGLEMSGRGATLTPDQLHNAIHAAEKYDPIVLRASALLGFPIFLLIIAVIGVALMKGVFGQQVRFKAAFSVTAYSMLPRALSGLMTIAVILFGDPAAFNPTNPAPTNPGFFLSPQTISRALYVGVSSLDIFTVWTIVLLGIGFSEAVERKTRAKSIFLFFLALWVLWVLIKMALTLI